MSTTCRCGETWTGHRLEHCTAPGCHQTFSGTTAGDRHRTGEHAVSTGPRRRRCLTPDEMRDKGLTQNAGGVWTTGRAWPWAGRPGFDFRGRPLSAEQDSPGVRGAGRADGRSEGEGT